MYFLKAFSYFLRDFQYIPKDKKEESRKHWQGPLISLKKSSKGNKLSENH